MLRASLPRVAWFSDRLAPNRRHDSPQSCVAKADLVPTDVNLRDDYASSAELEDACEAFMVKTNGRERRVTRRVPAEMLREEQQRLHRIPDVAFTAACGQTRTVSWSSTISFGGWPIRSPTRSPVTRFGSW